MHISEGFLPITHCIGWGVAALPPAVAQRARGRQGDGEQAREPRAAGGFRGVPVHLELAADALPHRQFLASHRDGGRHLFVRPLGDARAGSDHAGVPGLLLAHGGLTTLGANLFSLGVVGPWATWLFLRLLLVRAKKPATGHLRRHRGGRPRNLCHHCGATRPRLSVRARRIHASFLKFIGIFLITQIPISIAEGMLTVALLGALSATQMAALQGAGQLEDKRARHAACEPMTAIGAAGRAGRWPSFFANRHSPRWAATIRPKARSRCSGPAIRPIATPFYTPGPIAESVLFAAQGRRRCRDSLVGALQSSKARRQTGERVKRHLHLHPHLSDIAFTNTGGTAILGKRCCSAEASWWWRS